MQCNKQCLPLQTMEAPVRGIKGKRDLYTHIQTDGGKGTEFSRGGGSNYSFFFLFFFFLFPGVAQLHLTRFTLLAVAARSDKKNSRSLRYVVYGSICGFCLLINSHKELAGREGGSLVPVVVVVVQKKERRKTGGGTRTHTNSSRRPNRTGALLVQIAYSVTVWWW